MPARGPDPARLASQATQRSSAKRRPATGMRAGPLAHQVPRRRWTRDAPFRRCLHRDRGLEWLSACPPDLEANPRPRPDEERPRRARTPCACSRSPGDPTTPYRLPRKSPLTALRQAPAHAADLRPARAALDSQNAAKRGIRVAVLATRNPPVATGYRGPYMAWFAARRPTARLNQPPRTPGSAPPRSHGRAPRHSLGGTCPAPSSRFPGMSCGPNGFGCSPPAGWERSPLFSLGHAIPSGTPHCGLGAPAFAVRPHSASGGSPHLPDCPSSPFSRRLKSWASSRPPHRALPAAAILGRGCSATVFHYVCPPRVSPARTPR